jgi:hypothetical protein
VNYIVLGICQIVIGLVILGAGVVTLTVMVPLQAQIESNRAAALAHIEIDKQAYKIRQRHDELGYIEVEKDEGYGVRRALEGK